MPGLWHTEGTEVATEFFTLESGEIVVSGFLTPSDLARVQRGEVCAVILRRAMHGDTELGDWRCSFAGGELLPFQVGE